jgi:hypothetical protein
VTRRILLLICVAAVILALGGGLPGPAGAQVPSLSQHGAKYYARQALHTNASTARGTTEEGDGSDATIARVARGSGAAPSGGGSGMPRTRAGSPSGLARAWGHLLVLRDAYQGPRRILPLRPASLAPPLHPRHPSALEPSAQRAGSQRHNVALAQRGSGAPWALSEVPRPRGPPNWAAQPVGPPDPYEPRGCRRLSISQLGQRLRAQSEIRSLLGPPRSRCLCLPLAFITKMSKSPAPPVILSNAIFRLSGEKV